MGTMDSMIPYGYTRDNLEQYSKKRLLPLKTYAQTIASYARYSYITDLDGFVAVTAFAAAFFQNGVKEKEIKKAYFRTYLEDLKRVLIGDGFTNSERNLGTYALHFQAFLDTGFKKEFQDGGNQVQHAMAGIYISAVYGLLGREYIEYMEDSAADLGLYKATFEIGKKLDGENFRSLPVMIKSSLGV